MKKAFEHDIKLVRVMPNTPALVGEGMAALTPNSNVTKEETDVVVNVFNSFGKGESRIGKSYGCRNGCQRFVTGLCVYDD